MSKLIRKYDKDTGRSYAEERIEVQEPTYTNEPKKIIYRYFKPRFIYMTKREDKVL